MVGLVLVCLFWLEATSFHSGRKDVFIEVDEGGDMTSKRQRLQASSRMNRTNAGDSVLKTDSLRLHDLMEQPVNDWLEKQKLKEFLTDQQWSIANYAVMHEHFGSGAREKRSENSVTLYDPIFAIFQRQGKLYLQLMFASKCEQTIPRKTQQNAMGIETVLRQWHHMKYDKNQPDRIGSFFAQGAINDEYYGIGNPSIHFKFTPKFDYLGKPFGHINLANVRPLQKLDYVKQFKRDYTNLQTLEAVDHQQAEDWNSVFGAGAEDFWEFNLTPDQKNDKIAMGFLNRLREDQDGKPGWSGSNFDLLLRMVTLAAEEFNAPQKAAMRENLRSL